MLHQDKPHNPWSPEWNANHCHRRHERGQKCACGIFVPPLLIPAMENILKRPENVWHWPSRSGLCSVVLTNREFAWTWTGDEGPCLTWDAKTQLYTLKRNWVQSEPRVSASTQVEVLAKFIALQLEGGGR